MKPKLILSELYFKANAVFLSCDRCDARFTIYAKCHHIDKNGFWKVDYFCYNCGEKK